MKKKQFGNSQGLTLIELLVVMVIMGILATIGYGQYRTSQIKARDAQRKGDLDNVAKALEMYYNDNEAYPPDDGSGNIQVDTESKAWGSEFSTDEVIYMKTLPSDPNDDYQYCYASDGTQYKLYSVLENSRDSDYDADGFSCGGNSYYRYGVTSSNTTLEE